MKKLIFSILGILLLSYFNTSYECKAQNIKTDLLVTEIHYNPLEAGTIAGSEFEFIEFKNVGTSTLDLSSISFVSGITYTFSANTTLASGAFFVLASNSAYFLQRYGFSPNGDYDGQLDNGGEEVVMVSASMDTVLDINYNTSNPWPTCANGAGNSIVRNESQTSTNPSKSGYWRASTQLGGSPAADDPAYTHKAVYVNEILAYTTYPNVPFIEVYNPNSEAVDISGWFLTDNFNNPLKQKKWKIPANTIISANGYKTFNYAHYTGTVLDTNSTEFASGFKLNIYGEEAYIFSADASGNLTGYAHGFSYDAGDLNVPFARIVNSENHELLLAENSITKDAQNDVPKVGPLVISQINYSPDANNYEYIKIENITSSAVYLYDLNNTGLVWKMGGINFNFPQGVLKANASMFLIDSAVNVSDFRTKYSIPLTTNVYNYKGGLDNNGENISIKKPGAIYSNSGVNDTSYIDVDQVRYNNNAPWPIDANATGYGIYRSQKNGYGTEPNNWTTLYTLSIDNIEVSSNSLQLFPNPAKSTINIVLANKSITSVKLLDLSGKILLNENTNSIGEFSFDFSGNNIKTGIYILEVQSEKERNFQKISIIN